MHLPLPASPAWPSGAAADRECRRLKEGMELSRGNLWVELDMQQREAFSSLPGVASPLLALQTAAPETQEWGGGLSVIASQSPQFRSAAATAEGASPAVPVNPGRGVYLGTPPLSNARLRPARRAGPGPPRPARSAGSARSPLIKRRDRSEPPGRAVM
jgi:hypothetical protein